MGFEMDKRCYGLLMGVLGVTSCFGHALIAMSIRKQPIMWRKYYFLLALGVSDMLIASHAFLSTAAAFTSEWPFGDFICQLDAFVGMAATFASISFIHWIAKSKYYLECTSTKYINKKFHVQLEFFLACFAGFLPFFNFGEYGYETDIRESRTGCLLTFKSVGVKYWIYLILISVVWFVIPLYTIFTSYKKVSETRKEICWLQYVVPLQLLVSFTPYTVFAFSTLLYKVNLLSGFYVALNNVAAKIMIATNPFIYIITEPDLQAACLKFLPIATKMKESKEKVDKSD